MALPPAVILCGGLSRRMGRDKALILLDNRPMIAHVADRLRPQAGTLAINANGDPGRFAALRLPVIADTVPDRPGPLAGVLAAMEWAAGLGAASVVTAPVDTPALPADLVARLMAAGRIAIAASRDASGAMRRHPVCGLWPVALRDDLRGAIAQGQRRIGQWAAMQGAAQAEWDSTPDPFTNLNTPEDLARAAAPPRSG